LLCHPYLSLHHYNSYDDLSVVPQTLCVLLHGYTLVTFLYNTWEKTIANKEATVVVVVVYNGKVCGSDGG